MTTLQQIVDYVLNDYLLAGEVEQYNQLTSTIDADDTTLTFDFPLGGISAGTKIALGLETMRVMSTSGQTAVVRRGDFGSNTFAHTAGELVSVSPKFTPAQVLRHCAAELLSLPGKGVWQMKATNITYNASVAGYDLGDATAIDVWDVRADTSGPESDWPAVPYRVEQKMPTTGTHSFASGIMVVPLAGDPGRSFRVFYRAGFSVTLGSLSDNVETVTGIHSEGINLLTIGAAVRMMAGREIRRNQMSAQPDTRRAEEVSTGAQLQSVRGLLALYEQELASNRQLLARRYPPRTKSPVLA